MIFALHTPVSPRATSSTGEAAQPGEETTGAAEVSHKEEKVDLRQVQRGEVIEGVEQRASPRVLPLHTPPSMTPA